MKYLVLLIMILSSLNVYADQVWQRNQQQQYQDPYAYQYYMQQRQLQYQQGIASQQQQNKHQANIQNSMNTAELGYYDDPEGYAEDYDTKQNAAAQRDAGIMRQQGIAEQARIASQAAADNDYANSPTGQRIGSRLRSQSGMYNLRQQRMQQNIALEGLQRDQTLGQMQNQQMIQKQEFDYDINSYQYIRDGVNRANSGY